ncbi:RNA polymerase sigma-70 factor (ECF subfamily) [Nonlabens dokdonensis]|uniref:Sigma-24 (FecI-like) protein n=2 Tax=Nonlabens dokdonensis TaxID=328515 RepID=L7W8M4_NONDD|nr:RNA polymerase sigma factor [Nonlabens dokdonensis]AGC75208.1 sigma-24 (FecI-like) protein [Nonlabens dokdonensis DSW-6]PZX39050.1 RNA polymerase sigma-70 factor (ECF subfamily) [Nonlabens dokdonensis]
MTDSILIEKIAAGEKKLLPILVRRWHTTFCKKAYWILKDADLAKDIAQESWITIIDKLHTLDDPAKFKYWALRIVYNKSITVIQRNSLEQKRNKGLHVEQSDNDDAVSTENEEKKRHLLEAIKKLSIEKQNVIRLFYLENYTLKEIGDLLKISIGTVKSRLFNAREELKKRLKNNNYEN